MKLTAKEVLGQAVHEVTVEAETMEELQTCGPLLQLGFTTLMQQWDGEVPDEPWMGGPVWIRMEEDGPWHRQPDDGLSLMGVCGATLVGNTTVHIGISDPDDICEGCAKHLVHVVVVEVTPEGGP